MKTDSELADLFAGFSHPTRIAVLRALLPHCRTGRHFGDVAGELGIPPSTLKHHLDEMQRAGVLERRVSGRATILTLDLASLTGAAAQLARLCCSAETAPHQTNTEPDR
jgi:ArsR family transcriptional regulator